MNPSETDFITRDNILPFIQLNQYIDFVNMCQFVRQYRYMALLRGPAGSGKTVSAKRYRDSEPVITANGQSPVLYFQLARGEDNHKSFYRRVIEAITEAPYQKRLSAADLIGEAKRLLRRYGYDLMIVDEIGNMNNDGIEGARTLHDELSIPIVFIGMDDGFANRMSNELPQFYSRLAQILEFGMLDFDTLKYIVLPAISPDSLLRFSPDQKDADKITQVIFDGAGGSEEKGARFRDIQMILVRCHHLQRTEQEYMRGEGKTLRSLNLNVKLVKQATLRSKQRETTVRKSPPPSDNLIQKI